MTGDDRLVSLKQGDHLIQTQPHRLLFERYVESRLAVLCTVDYDFALLWRLFHVRSVARASKSPVGGRYSARIAARLSLPAVDRRGPSSGNSCQIYSSANFFIASKYFTIAFALFFPNDIQCHVISGFGLSTVGMCMIGLP